MPIRRRALDPDALVVGQTPLDGANSFYPYGQTEPLSKFFYLSSDEAFVRAGASVTLSLAVNGNAVGSSDLVLVWRFFDGGAWRELGRSTPSNPSVATSAWSFADGTRAFTGSGDVTFTVPLIWSNSSLFGRDGRWLRVDLDSGNYGSAGTFHPPFVRRAVVAYDWTPPTIQAIAVGVSVQPSNLFAADLAFVNEMPVDLGKDFYPLGERPRYNDTLYLASQEVFGKGGAAISISILVTNPAGTSTPAPPIRRVEPDQVRIAWEAWDGNAWQQVGLSQPGANGQSVGVTTFNFADTTLAFTTTGVVSFNAPSWVTSTTVNGETNTWLRARLVQGNYGRDATYVADADGAYHYAAASFAPPVLTSVGIGYRYEPDGPPTACKTYNNFAFADRSEALAPGDSFQPLETMLDRRPTLYLAFDQRLPNRSIALYINATATQQDVATPGPNRFGTSPITWEFTAQDGWVPLGVQDETRALQERGLVTFVGPDDQVQRVEFGLAAYWLRARWETGSAAAGPLLRRLLTNTIWASQTQTLRNELVGSSDGGPDQMFRTTRAPVLEGEVVEVLEDGWVRWDSVADFYASGPRDRHYVVERLSGEIRFGDGQHGMIPPRGRNNVRATLYRTGGGSRGNVAAGTIVQLLTTVPYVASLSNPEAAQVGADAETTRNLQERGPRELRHGGRAVTAIDFEDLALEASPEIARVRAITPRYSHSTLQWLDPSHPNATGDLSAYLAAGAGRVTLIVVPEGQEPRPIPSADLIRRVQTHVEQCCASNLDLFVDPPEWIEITATVEIVPVSLQVSDSLRVLVDTAISRYLHPLYGGPAGSGWAFGQQPAAGDLYPLIESLPAVDHVSSLTLRASALGSGDPERSLIFSGQHDITLSWPVGGP
jgi:hypothetical protein